MIKCTSLDKGKGLQPQASTLPLKTTDFSMMWYADLPFLVIHCILIASHSRGFTHSLVSIIPFWSSYLCKPNFLFSTKKNLPLSLLYLSNSFSIHFWPLFTRIVTFPSFETHVSFNTKEFFLLSCLLSLEHPLSDERGCFTPSVVHWPHYRTHRVPRQLSIAFVPRDELYKPLKRLPLAM